MSLQRFPAIALILALLFSPAVLHADEDSDELEQLRKAVISGQVLPLSTLRTMLLGKFPGEILKTELEMDDGRFIYEFKVLQGNGRLLEIEQDAATGRIIDVEDDD